VPVLKTSTGQWLADHCATHLHKSVKELDSRSGPDFVGFNSRLTSCKPLALHVEDDQAGCILQVAAITPGRCGVVPYGHLPPIHATSPTLYGGAFFQPAAASNPPSYHASVSTTRTSDRTAGKKAAEVKFPYRVDVPIPDSGLGYRLTELLIWQRRWSRTSRMFPCVRASRG